MRISIVNPLSALASALAALLLANQPTSAADLQVVATGLNNPRGLAFGPEGALYVTEAGTGGDDGELEGPDGATVHFGTSGAVTRIWKGKQERIATGLPSLARDDGSRAGGPQDISFQGRGNGYVVIGLGGTPEERATLGPAAAALGHVIKLRPSGGWSGISDVTGFEADANPDGGEVDSNPYAILALPGMNVVADAGANAVFGIRANGSITTLAVFPTRPVDPPPFLQLPPGAKIPMQSVPNCVAQGPDGALYVGQLTGFPFPVGAARVYRVVPGQDPGIFADDFTNIIDIDFGPDGSLYVLEFDSDGLLGPGQAAALIRVRPNGSRTTVASAGLVAPASVAIGADGYAYLSNFGVFPAVGQVVRIKL